MKLPVDLIYRPPGSKNKTATQVDDFRENLQRYHELIWKTQHRVLARENARDQGRSQPDIPVGELVYCFIPVLPPGFSPKLDSHWAGPFKVIKRPTASLVVIRPHGTWTTSTTERTVVINRVKAVDPDEEDETTEWGEFLDKVDWISDPDAEHVAGPVPPANSSEPGPPTEPPEAAGLPIHEEQTADAREAQRQDDKGEPEKPNPDSGVTTRGQAKRLALALQAEQAALSQGLTQQQAGDAADTHQRRRQYSGGPVSHTTETRHRRDAINSPYTTNRATTRSLSRLGAGEVELEDSSTDAEFGTPPSGSPPPLGPGLDVEIPDPAAEVEATANAATATAADASSHLYPDLDATLTAESAATSSATSATSLPAPSREPTPSGSLFPPAGRQQPPSRPAPPPPPPNQSRFRPLGRGAALAVSRAGRGLSQSRTGPTPDAKTGNSQTHPPKGK